MFLAYSYEVLENIRRKGVEVWYSLGFELDYAGRNLGLSGLSAKYSKHVCMLNYVYTANMFIQELPLHPSYNILPKITIYVEFNNAYNVLATRITL